MTIEYQGRTFTVEETADQREPYRLVGKRGGALSLVRVRAGRPLFWVRQSNVRIQGGYIGQLRDGSLLWIPSSGPQAPTAQRIWRANRAA